MALDFFVSHKVIHCALRQYLSLFGRDLYATWEGTGLLARAFARMVARYICYRHLGDAQPPVESATK